MRKLRVDEIDFRVGTMGKSTNGAYCTLLAYKDARVDMAVLDEVYTPELWQNEYRRDSKGVLQCGIGIYNKAIGQWVWKWSNGTESNTEKEKGEYSDAFKRAGFMVGIGRELYDIPTLFVNLKTGEFFEKDGKVRQTPKFKPNEWNWEITEDHVKASDANGQRVFASFGRGFVASKVQQAPDQLAKPIAAKPSKEKVVIKFGTPQFDQIVEWISEKEGTIEKAKKAYSISDEVEDEIKKILMLKSEIG